MFTKGDEVVYAHSGVCKVNDVVERYGKEYYELDPYYEDGIIFVPTDTKLFIRKVITKQEALDLIDSIPEIDEDMCNESKTNDLKKFYSSLVDEHTLEGLVKTIKSVKQKKQVRNGLGQMDRKYLKRAEKTLFGELACALEIPYDDVKTFIKKRTSQK